MIDPIIISGTAGEFQERRFCQFWGPFKIAGRERLECLASMATTDGLAINPQCPNEWLNNIWAAYLLLRSGEIPKPTHTVTWDFGRPTFTLIAAVEDAALFEIEGPA